MPAILVASKMKSGLPKPVHSASPIVHIPAAKTVPQPCYLKFGNKVEVNKSSYASQIPLKSQNGHENAGDGFLRKKSSSIENGFDTQVSKMVLAWWERGGEAVLYAVLFVCAWLLKMQVVMGNIIVFRSYGGNDIFSNCRWENWLFLYILLIYLGLGCVCTFIYRRLNLSIMLDYWKERGVCFVWGGVLVYSSAVCWGIICSGCVCAFYCEHLENCRSSYLVWWFWCMQLSIMQQEKPCKYVAKTAACTLTHSAITYGVKLQ